ncbi:MAG: hypothetical protein M3Q97_02815, partial [Bacteroidota bacterium]|nr:hypothetical protein [Bacteroidota bacterium]
MLLFMITGVSNAQKISVELVLQSRWDNDPDPLQTRQYFNEIWGWAGQDGREYAIIGSLDSTFFIEVTDPKNPVVRAAFAGAYNACQNRDYQTYKHYCYAVADQAYTSTLQIFDMQYLPDSVVKVYDSQELLIRAHDVFIEGGTAY